MFCNSGQAILEEFEAHLAKEEGRRDDADHRLQRACKILVQVKAGVEHLADKLHHLKAVSSSLSFTPSVTIDKSTDPIPMAGAFF